MIDRHQLRYFLAVVDHGNFTRAAAACNVSQPTLSVGIAKLEETLGSRLFQRNSQRVRLTPGGSRFLVHARRIESEFNLAARALAQTSNEPLMRVGVLKSLPGKTLAAIVREMRKRAPQAQVELVEGSERELLAHLSRGRIDFALTLVQRGGDRFLEEPLYEEGYVLALSSNHPLASESAIPAESLGNVDMILRPHCEALSETSRFFTERGVRPHFAFRSTNDERVLEMVAAGLGVTVMPEGFEAPGVAHPRLVGFHAKRTIGLAYRSTDETASTGPLSIVQAIRAVLMPGNPDITIAAAVEFDGHQDR